METQAIGHAAGAAIDRLNQLRLIHGRDKIVEVKVEDGFRTSVIETTKPNKGRGETGTCPSARSSSLLSDVCTLYWRLLSIVITAKIVAARVSIDSWSDYELQANLDTIALWEKLLRVFKSIQGKDMMTQGEFPEATKFQKTAMESAASSVEAETKQSVPQLFLQDLFGTTNNFEAF